tara:strand:+ start:1859 stop:2902 length:1044 start_codon:yes stop_codon:yes gene_type:complete
MILTKNKRFANHSLIQNLNTISIKKITEKEINFFNNKKILITGVSGIIGINLLFFFNKLNTEKKKSIYIDGTYNTSLFNFVKEYYKKNKKINFIKIDLTKNKIKKDKKYDFIFHCAGYGQPSKFLKYKKSTYKLNSITIIDLKNNLKKNGQFIYLSTTEIYSGNEEKCTEENVGNTGSEHPRSSYIDSKKFGESFIVNCFNQYVIFRACLIYGPGAKLNDERVLNQVIIRAIKNKKIDIYGGLKQLRSNLFISDAVNLMIKTITKSKNQIFNLSNHKMITLGKVFSMIGKIANKKIINHGSKMLGSPKVIKISNNKILKKTNYKISTDIRDGLLKTINWYKNLSYTK